MTFPVDVPVYQIRLSCTQANGQRYADSDILESGSPSFTPRVAISWQNPMYTRTPPGQTPLNPITLSANFTDEIGCPYNMYRFWAYGLNGTPVGGIGDATALVEGAGVTTTVSLPTGVPIYAVRLACVDTQGNRYANTSNLEVGNPAFTPTNGEGGSGGSGGTGGAGTGGVSTGGAGATGGAGTGGTGAGGSGTSAMTCVTTGDINALDSWCNTYMTTEVACNTVGFTSGYDGYPSPTGSLCAWTGTACHAATNPCETATSDQNTCTYVIQNIIYAGMCTWE